MNHLKTDGPSAGGIRVMLADDQALIRSGLQMLLSVHPGIEVVGEANDGAEAVDLARRLQPDVVVMDVGMPGTDGVAATRQITADAFTEDPGHTIKVIILTGLGSAPEDVFAALRAGASGYLLKDAAPTELAAAIESVAGGLAYLAPTVTPGVIADIASRSGPVRPVVGIVDRLTPREREILIHMAHGLGNDEIAKTLFLSVATVKTHVCRIIMKLEVTGRTQAVVVAYQSRLVEPGESA
ncbi:response regulator transcription factor [Actinoplanes sp. NEAU-A12]|uniref:Response regulator transcription factor n=1 Tax=Actinoplanes sandaracinus TaxID=3045177 RepID=A0ABT6WKY6_9ACTN|nr:response regulator transcription factor [Actinoplanes sandaracinus]MDI6100394.1 response regulator transcription factor [Actinoplanes sandaracinus]